MATVVPEQATYVVVQPRAAGGNPFKAMNDNWQAGLCDCFNDVSQCCYAFLLPPCFLCSLATAIDESMCGSCCVPYALAAYRMKVRSVYGIKGDACSDYCTISWCSCCAAIQLRNELTKRGL